MYMLCLFYTCEQQKRVFFRLSAAVIILTVSGKQSETIVQLMFAV